MRAARGQALVETALGVTVFVTILLLGIHFGEVGYLSIKAQEATVSAVFDSTARRIQRPGDAPAGHAALIGGDGAGGLSQARYADFDGSTVGGGAAGVRTALTTAQNLNVVCENAGGGGNTLSFAPTAASGAVYADQGELSCVASAVLDAPGIPRDFLNEGGRGFFSNQQRGALNMTVCGIGRATNGVCQARLGLLLNDWGMAGEAAGENLDCRLGACGNTTYSGIVNRVFTGQGGGGLAQGANMAQTLTGTSPVTASEFFMSFSGVEAPNGYRDGIGGHTAKAAPYNTGGPGAGLLTGRERTAAPCFLGMPGCN